MTRLGRSLRGKNPGEHWMEGLMGEDQRREFREIQAVMSLLEGFGDYVMDEVGRDLVPMSTGSVSASTPGERRRPEPSGR